MSKLAPIKPTVDTSTVEMLRGFLADAESGLLSSVAIAAVQRDGKITCGCTARDNRTGNGLVCAIERLKMRILFDELK